MKSRTLVISGLVVLLLGAFVYWWLITFERVVEDQALPMRGEARYNPLFALKLSLEAQGVTVRSRAHLDLDHAKIGTRDVIVLASDVRALGDVAVRRLTEWVAAGGRLVFPLPEGAEGEPGPLLDHFGITPTAAPGCLSWQKSDDTAAGMLCSSVRFLVEPAEIPRYAWLWGNANTGYLFGRRDVDEGRIAFAADLDFLRNSALKNEGNAALAWQLLAPMLGEGTVHLIYSADVPPLYVLIVRHGWPVLALLAIALLGWLWARSQRLGPVLPQAPTHRRALLEHVEASGQFAFRRGRALALHAALHRAVMARLLRRDPAVAALGNDALAQELATRTALPLAEVRQALAPVDIGHPERFIATIKTLMLLKAGT
jgi:hypothetical protein